MPSSTLPYISRRSVVHGIHGMVSTSQPLASQIGVDILRQGGNAADAAVAIVAALSVTEPGSTGPGGDASCLFYDSEKSTVRGINGTRRTPAALTTEYLKQHNLLEGEALPFFNIHTITVPGAVAAWADTIEHFGSGKFGLETLLQPAIKLAENGFPVCHIAASMWKKEEQMLKQMNDHKNNMLLDGIRAPAEGEIMQLPKLAETLRVIAAEGKDGFYKGRIADAIVDAVKSRGGLLTHKDLASHESEMVDPISFDYHDWTIWEMPPNSQGVTALMALGIIRALEEEHGLDFTKLKHNSTEYLHIIIEVMRLAFADTRYYVTDPQVDLPVATKKLLSKEYLAERAKLINYKKRNNMIEKGYPDRTCDTVYFSVVDKDGNACSFMGSNCNAFGIHIIPENCEFSLHNRGSNFALTEGHPNRIGPSKRCFHTMIPSMITRKTCTSTCGYYIHELEMCFGVMGAYAQPQAHVQVILNLMHYLTSPQETLDFPRICISPSPSSDTSVPANTLGFTNVNNCIVCIEDGIEPETIKQLEAMGHTCQLFKGYDRSVFGRGQIIRAKKWNGGRRNNGKSSVVVLAAGSDPRGDGQAIPLHLSSKF
ncbi:gamma-glutamyltranspeptidase [Circinella umbellata]|nr:gamma-glutamyltranspeptidase [Circinella umbellata]